MISHRGTIIITYAENFTLKFYHKDEKELKSISFKKSLKNDLVLEIV